MGRVILRWNIHQLARTIVATLLNKYDYFMAIEGGTGIGKSTLAFHIAHEVSKIYKRLYALDEETIQYYYERVGVKLGLSPEEFIQKILLLKQNNEYKFNPRVALIYSQGELQKALARWHNIAIPDEMINITFNRDFFSEKQKDIIKMLNMFRDHENLIIANVPQFQNLDNQIKNLCKMKITVKKRGVGIIHTPNQTVYCKDKWDSATNEKIEREWIIKKNQHPNYSKLTTFRGLVRFPPLTKKQEGLYQQIKNQKRSKVLRDEMKVKVDEKEDDPYQKVYNLLTTNGVKNSHVLEGLAVGLNMTPDQLRSKLSRDLKANRKPADLSYYYWQGKNMFTFMKEKPPEKEIVI